MNDGMPPATDHPQETGPSQLESEPAATSVVFGAALPAARRFVGLLAGPGTVRGLIGPREAGRLWTRHVLNCAVAATVMPTGAHVVDVGSGAGLPGIPMALARTDLRIDLVETLLRRTVFLDEVVVELGLTDRCRVVRGRAEDVVAQVGGADAVTARAVAPLAKLAAWSAPLLRDDGLFVALKGASAPEEIERDRSACAAVGIVDLSVRVVGSGLVAEPTTLVLGRRGAATPATRAGVSVRRPADRSHAGRRKGRQR